MPIFFLILTNFSFNVQTNVCFLQIKLLICFDLNITLCTSTYMLPYFHFCWQLAVLHCQTLRLLQAPLCTYRIYFQLSAFRHSFLLSPTILTASISVFKFNTFCASVSLMYVCIILFRCCPHPASVTFTFSSPFSFCFVRPMRISGAQRLCWGAYVSTDLNQTSYDGNPQTLG